MHGDVVTVGGRLRRDPGAQVGGSVTEVSLGDFGASVHIPWMWGWGPFHFGGFGPVTRLVGTTFRFVLLALVACLALVVARRAVEGSAQRVADEPVRSTLIGLVAWVLFVPMFMLDRRRAGDLDHRDSAAAPHAVCGAGPAADGDCRVQRHGQRGRSVGAAAIRDRHAVGVCRRVPRDPDHSPAGAARPPRGVWGLDAQPDRVPAGGDGSGRGVPRLVERLRRRPHQRVLALAGHARRARARRARRVTP